MDKTEPHHKRRILLALNGTDGRLAGFNHLTGSDNLRPVFRKAVLSELCPDSLFIAGKNNSDSAVLLKCVNRALYRFSRRVIPAHGINNDSDLIAHESHISRLYTLLQKRL